MRKQYILYIVIAILSLTNILNINNVSALDYSSNVGIGFTFNPTLSVSLSSSDLVIPNLVPGSTLDSNSINVSVATNASYGYTLSATVGDSNHDNSNLTHSNNIDIFSSIDLGANLETLAADNTWGYTSKLNNETIWNNYNGLSSSSNTILLDSNNTADSTGGIDFKIAAKASNTQPSGEYTGTINFITVTKVAPMSLLDSFIASGAEQLNGYFKIQDMTHDICEAVDVEESELQLIDVRDNKVYWVAKLKDGNCWMTQNLDLDLSPDRPLTSEDTDLNDKSLSGAYAENYTYNPENKLITWIPEKTTKVYGKDIGDKWANDNHQSNSMDVGQWYWNGNDDTPDCNFLTTKCNDFSQTSNNKHLSVGNYYNWTAAIASDNSISLTNTINANNSICPKNWRLPNILNNEFTILNNLYNNSIKDDTGLITSPLWFVRTGGISKGSLYRSGSEANYWSSTVASSYYAHYLNFRSDYVNTDQTSDGNRFNGRSIRCVAR